MAACFMFIARSNITPVSAAFSIKQNVIGKSTISKTAQRQSKLLHTQQNHRQSSIIPKSSTIFPSFSTSSVLALSTNNNNIKDRGVLLNSNRIKKHGRRKTAIHKMSSTMPHADIAVRLDQPLLTASSSRISSNASKLLKSMLTIVLSDAAKTACIAFLLALIIKFASKSSRIVTSMNHIFKLAKGQIKKFRDGIKKEKDGIPMIFEKDQDGNPGWGVCSLLSKKQIGRSNFMKYDFQLPKADNILNLALGQKVTLCCLNNDNQVAKKDYYLLSPKNTKGSFSILASMDGKEDEGVKLAKGEGNFSKVLVDDLNDGDEIALQPGPRTLTYRGEYLPVTDMLYIASGSGIVPVLDQVKAVLPSGSSSVKSVTVIWVNDREEDFDVALSSLEDEYFKYSTKLAVSCVVNENYGLKLAENEEVEEALIPFQPGTMSVIAASKRFSNEARAMLMESGYPEECICVLPL